MSYNHYTKPLSLSSETKGCMWFVCVLLICEDFPLSKYIHEYFFLCQILYL